ncbi:MAG: ATP-binding protein [Actinomycetota bacterium]
MTIKVQLFGSPSVRGAEGRVTFDTRKALALLAYLGVTARPQPRDELVSFLWPEADLERGRGALRRTLSSIRSALGREALEVDRSSAALSGEVEVDVTFFRRAVHEADEHPHKAETSCDGCLAFLERAADMNPGSFMAGFSLKDSPSFEEWRGIEEEALRRELGQVFKRLVAMHEARGDYQRGLAHATRWIALDVLHEPAHVAAMRLLALDGDREGALRQFRVLSEVLKEELDVAPLEGTVKLERQISSGVLSAPARDRVPTDPSGERQPMPFVGRTSELQLLADAIERARSAGRVIFLEGEAGIGKTRLVHEAARRAALHSTRLVEVPSHEEEREHAYGVIARLLSSIISEAPASRLERLDDDTLAEAARLVPDLVSLRDSLPDPVALTDPGAKTIFFERVWEAMLVAIGNEDLPLVLLEDLHWSDETSVDLLAFMLRRVKEGRVLLILTWRTEAVPREHRLRKLVADARRNAVGDHLKLDRLEEAEVLQLVTRSVPEASDDVARRVYIESEGVPFFVSEYVGLLVTQGSTEGGLPDDALQIVRARVDAVAGVARQVMTAASVLGRSFDLALVQATGGRGDEEMVDALDELIAKGLITEVKQASEPSFDFTHETIRSVVYEDASSARRRLLHGRAADHLAGRPERRAADVSLAAYHFERAGRREEAARFHRDAGDLARYLFANSEALQHYLAAIELGHPETPVLHEAAGDMAVLLGRYEQALESYAAASALTDEAAQAQVERKLASVRLRRGERDVALNHLEKALAASEADGRQRGQVLAELSRVLTSMEPDRAGALALEALSVAETHEDPALVSRSLNLLGMIDRRSGRIETAATHLERSLEAAAGPGEEAERIAALNNLALVRKQLGDVESAIELAQQGLELCSRRGDLHRQAALHSNLADLLHAAGREEDSRKHAKQAAALFAQVGDEPVSLPEVWKLTEW